MVETRTITFKNSTGGPKGVHGVNGLVLIDAGKSADVEVTEGEFRSAAKTGWFEGQDDDDEDFDGGLTSSTVAELKALAEAEDIDLGDATKKADIITAIELAREERAKA